MLKQIIRILSNTKRKIFGKKIRTKRKNYMMMHYDEVKMQKIYTANWRFYLRLILFPSIITLVMVIVFVICEVLTELLSSLLFGILGSYIASVIVTWLIDVKTCEIKTFERMRFQQVYFADLKEICSGFIFFYISYLANNFSEESKKRLSDGKKNIRYFKGYPWQYWSKLLNEIIQTKYPFAVRREGDVKYEWIDYKSESYVGDEFEIVKEGIEKEAEEYFSSYIRNSDFIDRVVSTIVTYRSSLSNVYVNDYIYNLQLQVLNDLLNDMEDFANCVIEKKYIDFWYVNNRVLTSINVLSSELFPFRYFRENEHIYKLSYRNNNEANVHFGILDEFVNDEDDPAYTFYPRKEYRKIKKQNKVNEQFESENPFVFDNGWY